MRITKEAYNEINCSISGKPPETGGILGSSNGSDIDKIAMDTPQFVSERLCSYAPNVDFLNSVIAEWQDQNIEFKGIFHTHFVGVETLSCADKQYIKSIMLAMPDDVKYLYFPIFVLPNRKLVSYRAEIQNGEVHIAQDNIVIKRGECFSE